MRLFKHAFVLAAALCAAYAGAAEPHIGYAYPADAQQGTTVQVLIGGQLLRGVSGVHLSGSGVQGTVIAYGPPLNNKALMELRKAGMQLLKARRNGNIEVTLVSLLAQSNDVGPLAEKAAQHPLLQKIDKMDLQELEYWAAYFADFRKRQPNPQIADTVLVELNVAPDAAPGWRDLRLKTPGGLTNPLCFYVGNLPEVQEKEPNDTAPSVDPATTPVVLNGQIYPGDRDRFSIRATKGQKLLLRAQARRLIPYLADAVPGWFQATLALYDPGGDEVAYADDYRFDPDPVMLYQIPADGVYTVEIHDALFRGREDFVYSITVGELPFVTQISPLGGKMGEKASVSAAGWNIERAKVQINTDPGEDWLRRATLTEKGQVSNSFAYAVDALPECSQKEPNDSTAKAQKIELPVIINGVIERPDDVDVYRFKGHAGDKVVAEVSARRLGSPLDSLLRLTDASGKVIELNDDHKDLETGLVTHQADSYLCAELKEDGEYCLEISDTQHAGGAAYGYRLRVSPPQPDFALRVTPSCINVGTGRDAVVSVCALRRDSFDGPIDLSLKDMPAGFTLSGGRIPAGRESIRMTLRAPRKAPVSPLPLHIEGSAQIDGKAVSRSAEPAEDMMQAFLYRHLVPEQELLVAVTNPKRPAPPLGLAKDGPTQIPLGGTAQVTVNTPPRALLETVRLELSDPPKGVSLQDMAVVPDGVQFTLKADGAEAGLQDNLIVQAFSETETPKKGSKTATVKQRADLGPLPAVPIEIVKP